LLLKQGCFIIGTWYSCLHFIIIRVQPSVSESSVRASNNPAVGGFITILKEKRDNLSLSLPSCPALQRQLRTPLFRVRTVHHILLYRRDSELKHFLLHDSVLL
jgi:hypothetical protein